jgi:tripartite-type tricarboxylate transporter receptor subunit TctC
MLNRRRFAGLAAAALAAPSILASRAFGANWPTRPVRVVVPFTPGGSTDITARLVSNRLQEVWGQSVVVENKPGAGGNIASRIRTLMATPSSSSAREWPPTRFCIHR